MITAVTINYFSHQLTVRAALSVLADRPDAQVIVVDNSECADEATSLRELLPPQVDLIVTPENIGFGRACNLGFAAARHDLILLLNPDAIVLPGCLDALAGFLRQTPQAGAVAPLAWWDREKTWLLPPGQLPTPVSELSMSLALRFPRWGARVSMSFRKKAQACFRSRAAVRQRMLSGGHVLLRRSAVEKAGGPFDPALFMYYEDTDLCRRLDRAGFGLYLLPGAEVVHEWCCTQDKGHLSRVSHEYYFGKHFSGSPLLRVFKRLERSGLPLRLPEHHDLGLCRVPPRFPVAAGVQGEWLMEISPQPLFVPALYHFGSGSEACIPEEIWERLGPGRYWLRIGPPDGGDCSLFSWEIPANPSKSPLM
ncbi:MAG: glycosyltransferase [Desulfuromonadales bacterium]